MRKLSLIPESWFQQVVPKAVKFESGNNNFNNRTSERQINSWTEYKNTNEIGGARALFRNKIGEK